MPDVELGREALLELVDDAFFVFDSSGNLVEWNAVTERLSGYTPEELETMHATDFFEASDRTRINEAISELTQTGEARLEALLLTKNGDQIPYEFRGRLLPDGSGFVGIGRDISTNRAEQAAARHREAVLRKMYEIISDRDRSFAEQVRALLELGREEINIEYGTLSQIRGSEYLFEFVSADDESITEGDIVSLSATNCEIAVNREQTVVVGDIARDTPKETDREGYTEWGISCYLGAPVFTDNGVYGTFCFYDTDTRECFTEWEVTLVDLMSQWVSHELRHQQARRRLEQQNSKLEQFASVVSHDLRNPLNVLTLGLEDDGTDTAKRNLRAVARMEALIDDLLLLARAGKGIDTTTEIALAPLVRRAWEGVETKDATLVVETDMRMQADERRLEQLLENLFRNAIEHARADVTVTVGRVTGGFYVEDDGPGISSTNRDDVFEGGFSTKSDGTGFGLSIVREIATAHGWSVHLTESSSGGARFEFTDVSIA